MLLGHDSYWPFECQPLDVNGVAAGYNIFSDAHSKLNPLILSDRMFNWLRKGRHNNNFLVYGAYPKVSLSVQTCYSMSHALKGAFSGIIANTS